MAEDQGQKRIELLLFYGAVLTVFYLAYRVFEPFLEPLGWAAVIVICIYPLHARFLKKFTPARAAVLSTLCVFFLLVGPALSLVGGLVAQARFAVHYLESSPDFSGQIPPSAQVALDWLQRHGVQGIATDPVVLARDIGAKLARRFADRAGDNLRNVAAVSLKVLVLLFALFFLFRDGPALVLRLNNLLPFDEAHRARVMAQTRDLIFASVTASLVIGMIQGVLGTLAFLLVGLPSALFWGALMGLLALLPLIGAWLVWGSGGALADRPGQLWQGDRPGNHLRRCGRGPGALRAADLAVRQDADERPVDPVERARRNQRFRFPWIHPRPRRRGHRHDHP